MLTGSSPVIGVWATTSRSRIQIPGAVSPTHTTFTGTRQAGLVVVQADPDLHDLQIEICPSGAEPGKGEHQHILERPGNGQTMYAAVFPGRRQGSYTLLTHDNVRTGDVLIPGGSVTTVAWRGS